MKFKWVVKNGTQHLRHQYADGTVRKIPAVDVSAYVQGLHASERQEVVPPMPRAGYDAPAAPHARPVLYDYANHAAALSDALKRAGDYKEQANTAAIHARDAMTACEKAANDALNAYTRSAGVVTDLEARIAEVNRLSDAQRTDVAALIVADAERDRRVIESTDPQLADTERRPFAADDRNRLTGDDPQLAAERRPFADGENRRFATRRKIPGTNYPHSERRGTTRRIADRQ